MVFSPALYLVRAKNIKQVHDTFLQGFNKKTDYHIHSGSVWLWHLGRESYHQRWTNIASQEGRHLVFIFDMDILSVQFSSVAQSCPTLCDPMNCSMPGLPVHYQLPEFTQTHVHRVGDAIQPSHPLSSPSPALNPSQHQSFPTSQLFA